MEDNNSSKNNSTQHNGNNKRLKLSSGESLQYWGEGEGNEEVPYSDWTLVVQTQGDDNNSDEDKSVVDITTRTFSVHQLNLGPKSPFFNTLFRKQFAEASEKRSVHKFPSVVVKHFHAFLDYCYGPEEYTAPAEVCTLLYLGDYFGMETLSKISKKRALDAVKAPCESDGRYSEYYQCATSLGLSFIVDALVEKCSRACHAFLEEHNPLFAAVDLEFMLRVLRQAKAKRDERDAHNIISGILHQRGIHLFLTHHETNLKYEDFLSLTDQDLLPLIFSDYALPLLEMELRLIAKQNADSPLNSMTCLQKRCLGPLNKHVLSFDVDEFEAFVLPEGLPPSFTLALWRNSMKRQTKLEITNAGSDIVNGIYLRSSPDVFKKQGGGDAFNGNAVKVSIYEDRDGEWIIHAAEANDSHEFYHVDSEDYENDHYFPTSPKLWKCSEDGVLPVPTFKFL